MRRIVPRTFFAQLLVGIIVAQTLVLGAYLYYVVRTTRQESRKTLEARISRQIDHLAAACTEQIHQGDYETLHDLLEMAEIAPSIQSTRITDLKGNTVAASKGGVNRGLDSEELKVLPTVTGQHIFRSKRGQVEAVTPLLENGKPVALLWLEPNPTAGGTTAGSLVRIALTYGALALLANLLPIFLIVRRMTTPIRRLSLATQRVVRGTLPNPEFPLPVTGRNEAGALTENFNTMVRELEEQRSGLLETLALLDSMLGNAPVGFAFLDAEFRFVRRNDFFSVMFGMEEADGGVLAGPLANVLKARVQEVFDTGKGMRNVEIRSDSGELPRAWLLQFYPVRTNAQAVRWVGVVGGEITERLLAEETLRRTEKLAAAGRLAASVAHEINNPLESVTNLLYLAGRSTDVTEIHGYLETAEQELARVSVISAQTLRFYKQSTGPRSVTAQELFESVVSVLQGHMLKRDVRLHQRWRAQKPVLCLDGEIRQVLANLVTNAIDALPDRGGQIFLRSHEGQDGRGRKGVYLVVADTGSGMPAEVQKRLFEAFFTTKGEAGNGLGMWVSKEIVDRHEASLRVRSSQRPQQSGTVFRLFLPFDLSVA
jgi:signal transduction histidine kinase